MRILVFDIDCLRPDHLGCYGYHRPTSPNIDAIAARGTRFNNYYCASSPCLPSRMEWSSGRFGIRNGVVTNHGPGSHFRIRTNSYVGPAAENQMLMRSLRAAGWDTISFTNFADRHNTPWFMCGWSEFHTPNLKGGLETADEIHQPLMRWLKDNGSRDNYLLHINYWDTHRPYKMDGSWAERFRDFPVRQEFPNEQAIADHQSIHGPFTAHAQFGEDKSPFPLMPGAINNRADFEHMVTGYDASIAYVDHHIGMVLEELDRQGLLEDTAIIVMSDHGDAFGEHGVYSDHVCADDCIHHIPLIVHWPGVTSPQTSSDALLYNVDLPPTLSQLMGAEIPPDWDGASFAGALQGQEIEERDHLVWTHALYTVQRAVRTREHLYIRTYHPLTYPRKAEELYQLAEDPYQTTDISDQHPDIVAGCREKLQDWLAEQTSKSNMGPDPVSEILEARKAWA